MGLGQHFSPTTLRIARPTISAENPGVYGGDPRGPRQTIEQHLPGPRFDRAMVNMTNKRRLDH